MCSTRISETLPDARNGNRVQSADWAPHGAYPCRGSDEWIAIAVPNDANWQGLVAEMGKPAWASEARFATAAGRKANEDEIDRALGEYTKTQDRYELMDRLQRRGIAACAQGLIGQA